MKIPARYIGPHSLVLGSFGGPYFAADGNRLENLVIGNGDTLMMDEGEIRGETYIITPDTSLYLGTGRRVRPEDAHKSDEELAAIGYQFHKGRTDFEEIVPEQPTTEPATTEVTGATIALSMASSTEEVA